MSILGLLGGSLWLHLLAPTTFILLFTLPPFPMRRLVLATTATIFFYFCLLLPPDTNPRLPLQLRYGFAAMWMHYLGWFAKMLLHNPEHDFWRNGHTIHEAEKMGFGWEKLKWAWDLLTAWRGVGWNFEIPNLPPRREPLGRWLLVLRQTLLASALYLLSDALLTFLSRQPFHTADHTVAHLPPYWKAILEAAILLNIWINTEFQFATWSALLVATGLAREPDFVPLFGDITTVSSLEDFWGHFWHQNLRIMFLDYGRAICWLLRVRRGTRLSWLIQVWVAFFISGAMHTLASWSSSSGGESFAPIFLFFVLQPVGLTIEIFFLDTPGKDIALYEVGLEDERLIGKTWTYGWLLFSGQFSLDCWLRTEQGMQRSQFSVSEMVLKRIRT